jgi:ubiquinone/menaquinone biosynthesis C-methylase UbiE
MLEALEIDATLRDGDIYALPYEDKAFPSVVCVSVLEHLTDLDGASREVARVLAPGGFAVIGFPVANRLTSALFKWLGYDAGEIHPSSHLAILAALERRFHLRQIDRLPERAPSFLGLYIACRCDPR